jgi:hypothetical protein
MNYCECDMPQRWAKDPEFRIEFDQTMNEYYIVFGKNSGGKYFISFCPDCGGKMPQSKRDEYFMEPLETELHEMRELLKKVKDAVSMRQILGEPDDVWNPSTKDEDEIHFYDVEKFKTQYTYSCKWQTLDLCINEKEDGSVSFFWSGKAKPKE